MIKQTFILCFNFNSAESTRQSGKEVFMDKIIQEAANMTEENTKLANSFVSL